VQTPQIRVRRLPHLTRESRPNRIRNCLSPRTSLVNIGAYTPFCAYGCSRLSWKRVPARSLLTLIANNSGKSWLRSQQQVDQVDWRPLTGVEPRRMVEARLQSHYATQWLARIARAYIPPQSDDGHTSLLWNRALDALMTQPLQAGLRFGLRIPDLVIILHDSKSTLEMICLEGHSDLEIRDWLGRSLSAQGFDARALDAPLPYQLPAYAIAKGAKYDAVRSQTQALAELAAWFANSDLLLSDLQRQMCERGFAASPVRCWPHHFDIATLTTLPNRDAAGYVGAGLSPGDEHYEGPYFYVSVYPQPSATLLPKLPSGGHWHTREFAAAVLPWDKVLRAYDQKASAIVFLHGALAAAHKILA